MRGCIGGDAARLNGQTARSSLATYDRTATGTARFTATRDPMRKKNRPTKEERDSPRVGEADRRRERVSRRTE